MAQATVVVKLRLKMHDGGSKMTANYPNRGISLAPPKSTGQEEGVVSRWISRNSNDVEAAETMEQLFLQSSKPGQLWWLSES